MYRPAICWQSVRCNLRVAALVGGDISPSLSLSGAIGLYSQALPGVRARNPFGMDAAARATIASICCFIAQAFGLTMRTVLRCVGLYDHFLMNDRAKFVYLFWMLIALRNAGHLSMSSDVATSDL